MRKSLENSVFIAAIFLFGISIIGVSTALAEDAVIENEAEANEAAAVEQDDCTWQKPEDVCDFYFPGSCPASGFFCVGKDCLGVSESEEAIVIPIGAVPKTRWLLRSEGNLFAVGYYVCNIMQTPAGLALLEFPLPEEHAGCLIGLQTNDHTYIEMFAGSNSCTAWVECQCD